MSVRPTDVCPSDRFALGFLYLPPLKGKGKAPEGGPFASILKCNSKVVVVMIDAFISQKVATFNRNLPKACKTAVHTGKLSIG